MWQHLLYGIDPNQVIDATVQPVESAAGDAFVIWPAIAQFPNGIPRNQAAIVHGLNVVQTAGAFTARKLQLMVGPSDGVGQIVILEEAITSAGDFLILRRPVLLPAGWIFYGQRNGADAGSKIAINAWVSFVSVPAKRSLDGSKPPSPKRLDEIFPLVEG